MNNPVDLCLSCRKASDCPGRLHQIKRPDWIILCPADLIGGIVIDSKLMEVRIKNGHVEAWLD